MITLSNKSLNRWTPSIPVIGVGGIENGNTIDQMLQEERLDFAAVGRALLKDPEAWKKSHLYAENLGAAL